MSQRGALRRWWRPPTAIAVAVASIAVLAGLAWGVLGDGGLEARDRLALDWIRAHTPAVAASFLGKVSQWHRPRAIVAATGVALAVLLWRRERAGALLLAVTVGGGATLNHLLKHAVQRPRPDDVGRWVAVTDFSFPSGHVANATLLYATLAMLIAWRLLAARAGRGGGRGRDPGGHGGGQPPRPRRPSSERRVGRRCTGHRLAGAVRGRAAPPAQLTRGQGLSLR